ncbi:MAG: hypothetical protein KME46_15365 [Brasilonema angustatum HA4187-MV1]|nr:hypothetical protein [Brasilonema angustatum HA4187-MV1]
MVHLKNFSLVSPDIQSGELLKAIEMAIPAFAIEQALSEALRRNRQYPKTGGTQALATSAISGQPGNSNESLV